MYINYIHCPASWQNEIDTRHLSMQFLVATPPCEEKDVWGLVAHLSEGFAQQEGLIESTAEMKNCDITAGGGIVRGERARARGEPDDWQGGETHRLLCVPPCQAVSAVKHGARSREVRSRPPKRRVRHPWSHARQITVIF